jgi:hypothetical protein
MSYDAASLLETRTLDDEFDDQLKDLKLFAVCTRPYIRVQKLKEWLRLRPSNAPSYTHFERILKHKVHTNTRNYVDTDSLLAEGEDARSKSVRMDLVFSILMVLRRPELLGQCQERDLRDHALPIPLSELKSSFREFRHLQPREANELAEKFDCIQWSFTPVVIERRRLHCRQEQLIIPIHRMENLRGDHNGQPFSHGLTSQIYVVEVLEEFLSPALTKLIPDSCYSGKNDALGLVSLL